MSALESLIIVWVSTVVYGIYLAYKAKKSFKDLKNASDKIRDFWRGMYEKEYELHRATKAELEQYKNHESET